MIGATGPWSNAAGKYAGQPLKASSSSSAQRTRYACFVSSCACWMWICDLLCSTLSVNWGELRRSGLKMGGLSVKWDELRRRCAE